MFYQLKHKLNVLNNCKTSAAKVTRTLIIHFVNEKMSRVNTSYLLTEVLSANHVCEYFLREASGPSLSSHYQTPSLRALLLVIPN